MAKCITQKKLVTKFGIFKQVEKISYSNNGWSEFYQLDETIIILDYDICKIGSVNKLFSYLDYTKTQNRYVNQNKSVFRFLAEDSSSIDSVLNELKDFDSEKYFSKNRHVNREGQESSPLEISFEDNFLQVYGSDSLQYLYKEYEICDSKGNTFFLDYLVKGKNWTKAVEENGITYHHPQNIGVEKYRRQLEKQNTCAIWGIKLFRFSSEDCRFQEANQTDIKYFFGSSTKEFVANGLLSNRTFKLYNHQENTLEEIVKQRHQGIKSFLIVFPTASGKSKIVEEDIKVFEKQKPNARYLVIVPNTAIKNDWKTRVENSLKDLESQIEIQSYGYVVRHYNEDATDKYNYIVIDEAHHAVAPMLKRVIQYYTPDFLIGLTATDQRPDNKKLEEIFGSYKTGLSLEDAMKQEIIAQANVYRIETNIDLSKVRINGKEYVNADLEKTVRVTSRNELIAEVLKKYFSNDSLNKLQGIIFCVNTNHASEMEKVLCAAGFTAKAYTNRTPNCEKVMDDFRQKKIRFLCSCNMISEGWDYPELGILVMARPTLSKVLYLQQLGRGLRKTPSKQNVFVLDVVDEYGAAIVPYSMHSIFHLKTYVPFGNVLKREYKIGEFIEIPGLVERVERIVQIDTSTFEEKFGNYLSQEQVAREYFVSTGTITSWMKKGKIIPDASFPFGSKTIYLFSPQNVKSSKVKLEIPEHSDATVYKDFFDFLEERDYSLSYKMPFMLGVLKSLNENGDANISDILDFYIDFYKDRIMHGLVVDRKTCPYSEVTLKNRIEIQRSMLTNPFEKFERKRFMFYSKELGMISLNSALFDSLKDFDYKRIENQIHEDLKNYYEGLGSEYIRDVEYRIKDDFELEVAEDSGKIS